MLKVKVNKGNIEKALKQLKRKYIKTKVPKECKERKDFTKKSVKRREEIKKAIYKQKKYDDEN